MDHGHMTYGMARECYDIVMETSLTVSGKTTRLAISELVYFCYDFCLLRTPTASWAWHSEVR